MATTNMATITLITTVEIPDSQANPVDGPKALKKALAENPGCGSASLDVSGVVMNANRGDSEERISYNYQMARFPARPAKPQRVQRDTARFGGRFTEPAD